MSCLHRARRLGLLALALLATSRPTPASAATRSSDEPRASAAPTRVGPPQSIATVQTRRMTLPEPTVLNDDGGWCWFQDERALVLGRKLLFGSVASGRTDALRRGAVEATSVDLDTGKVTRARLNTTPVEDKDRYDDHDAPAFVLRSDDRVLAVWTGHGTRNAFYTRVSAFPGDGSEFGPERSFVPSPTSRLTYANLHRLPGTRRVLDFFRGKDDLFQPSLASSDDDGDSWTTGPIVIDVPATVRHRPYVKYASDGHGGIHLVYSEGHPRDFDNSLYHVVVRDGWILDSRGTRLRPLEEGLPTPEAGTRLFQGDAQNVAWPTDLDVDSSGRPVVAFSVQKDSAGLPPGQGGADHRYFLGRWIGERWNVQQVAFAGSRLYAGEDDYTGGVALTPGDPSVLYLSTNVDPGSGVPLVSKRDGQRHWEIFRGTSGDDGGTWSFVPVTQNSVADNLRPIVPSGRAGHGIVIWLRGRYRSYTDYALEVVGLVPSH